MRRLSPVELAVGFAAIGSTLAVAVPTFVREVHASRFVEPLEGLARIGAGAVAYAEQHGRFPDSAALTPATPPRGRKEVDPPGTWDAPTWRALSFRPAAEGAPHAYAFSFESTGDTFVARARGDLDGDGVFSTFEIRGAARSGEKAAVAPGIYVEAELE
jgi:hypothetical protein